MSDTGPISSAFTGITYLTSQLMRARDPDLGQITLQDSGSAPRGEHRRSGRRFDALAALGFLLFAFVLVWPVLLGRVPVASDTLYLWAPWSQLPHEPVNTPVLADSSLLFLPWMVFGREAVQAGEWPLWDPHSFAGFPYAANSQNQLYYPLTWLLWLLPLSAHIQVLVVFNIWFAGFGAYLFTRRLAVGRCAAFIAGVAFAGSGIMQLVIELWGVSSVYAWLPWVMYFTDRALTERHSGWTAAAASAVALQLVAGHLQYAVYTLFLLGVWVLLRMATDGRAVGPARVAEYAVRSAGIAALGVGAALVHLAPLFELSGLSGRAGARVSSNSPPLSSMLRSLAPQFFGDGGTTGSPLVFNDLWYAGVPALILAVLALFARPRGVVWLWAGLGAVAVAVGYGIGPFLYARWLPGLSGMLPIRIGYLFVFAVAVLAALGVDAYMRLHAKRPRSAFLTLGLVLTLVTLALVGALGLRAETSDAALGALQDQQAARAASISAVTLIALAIVTGILRKSPWRRKAVFASIALLAALQMADLATAVPDYNSYVRPEAIMPASPAVEWLRARSAEGRVLGRGVGSEQPVLVPNVQLLYGLQSVAGYDSLHTRDYED
ncbi:MAG TPA: YfhO family protein, partial [Chloroflexia bacterium]|nr:YfhO family protein [Chloroflexia bacterium]